VEQRPVAGFVVAGYDDHQSATAEIWEFQLPRDSAAQRVAEARQSGALWRGVEAPFTRLWMGFDPQLPVRASTTALAKPDVDALFQDLEYGVAYDGMPIQDAVDFASFIVETTIGVTTFLTGVASCGGPVQLAIILEGSGFQWISKPEIHVRPRSRR
jgi:hypothetical protein